MSGLADLYRAFEARGLGASVSRTFSWQAKCHVLRFRGASNPEAIDHKTRAGRFDLAMLLRPWPRAGRPAVGGASADMAQAQGALARSMVILLTTDKKEGKLFS